MEESRVWIFPSNQWSYLILSQMPIMSLTNHVVETQTETIVLHHLYRRIIEYHRVTYRE